MDNHNSSLSFHQIDPAVIMALPPASPQPFASPKRKRESSSPYDSKISPSKPRNAGSLQTYPLLLAQQACNDEPSPSQTSVTGKFQRLAIRANGSRKTSPPIQHDRKRLATMGGDLSPMDSSTLLKEFQLSSKDENQPASASSFDFATLPAIVPDPPRRQSRSPPLNGEPQDNFWHDSEITGHNPSDPADDGEGINGIGFKPTPAIAWARSQKRKQQLADYKSRETREARQRRIERRRVSSSKESEKANENARSTKTRVRFEDG